MIATLALLTVLIALGLELWGDTPRIVSHILPISTVTVFPGVDLGVDRLILSGSRSSRPSGSRSCRGAPASGWRPARWPRTDASPRCWASHPTSSPAQLGARRRPRRRRRDPRRERQRAQRHEPRAAGRAGHGGGAGRRVPLVLADTRGRSAHRRPRERGRVPADEGVGSRGAAGVGPVGAVRRHHRRAHGARARAPPAERGIGTTAGGRQRTGAARVALPLAAFGIAIIGFGLPTNGVEAATTTATTAIVVLSLVVVTGYTGQLSLAQFALAGTGAWYRGAPRRELRLPVRAGRRDRHRGNRARRSPGRPARAAISRGEPRRRDARTLARRREPDPQQPSTHGRDHRDADRLGLVLRVRLRHSYPSRALRGARLRLLRRARVRRRQPPAGARRKTARRGPYQRARRRFARHQRRRSQALRVRAGGRDRGRRGRAHRVPTAERRLYPTFSVFQSILVVLYAVIGGIGYVAGALIGAALAPSAIVPYAFGDLFHSEAGRTAHARDTRVRRAPHTFRTASRASSRRC